MFGFTSRRGRDLVDPLQTRRTAAEWFRALPGLDVIARHERVLREFSALRHSRREFDLDRVAAILFLDVELAVDHRRLLKWYFDDLRGSGQLAGRFWQAAHDVCQALISAYEAAHAAALRHPDDRRWSAALPRLTARLVHFHGVDIGLRLFRDERCIPAKWKELHRLFVQACELGYERAPTALPGEDPLSRQGTVEHEYVYALLLDQLHTGNLTPPELDWAGTKLHVWCKDLALETAPTTDDGFFVDLVSTVGLRRREGKVQGEQVGYLDTRPLVDWIENAIAVLREPEPDGRARTNPLRQQRIAILEKIRPAVSPSRRADLRRHERVPVSVAVEVRVGLAHIVRELASPQAPAFANAAVRAASPAPPKARPAAPPFVLALPAGGGTEEIEIPPVADDPQFNEPLVEVEPPAQPAAPALPQLRLLDRSVTGWRLHATGGAGQDLALGALVAVRTSDVSEWTLGVVSRVAKGLNQDVEAGVSLIAGRVVPVTLYGRRRGQAHMSFVVDGIDVSTIGTRFDGLYLLPPAHGDTRRALRTLIVPTSEHFEGRNVLLTTPRSDYAVTMGQAIDQHADWSWVKIQVSAKAA